MEGKYEIWATVEWLPTLSADWAKEKHIETGSPRVSFEVVMPKRRVDRKALRSFLGIEIEDFVKGAKPPENYAVSYYHQADVVWAFPRSRYAYLLAKDNLDACPFGKETPAWLTFQVIRVISHLETVVVCLALLMVALYVWRRGGIRHLLDAMRKRNRNVESGRIVH